RATPSPGAFFCGSKRLRLGLFGNPNQVWLRWVAAMTDQEKMLLVALVKMVDQYLDEDKGQVDSLSMSAGEHAIEALAEFGLMERINTRFGQWTVAGQKFLAEAQGWAED